MCDFNFKPFVWLRIDQDLGRGWDLGNYEVGNLIQIGPSIHRMLNWFQSRHPCIATSGFDEGITLVMGRNKRTCLLSKYVLRRNNPFN